MNDHPLPWEVIQPDHDQHAYIVDVEGNQIMRMPAPQAEAARHIVACVNACKGFTTDQLAGMSEGFLHAMARVFSTMDGFTESEGGEA